MVSCRSQEHGLVSPGKYISSNNLTLRVQLYTILTKIFVLISFFTIILQPIILSMEMVFIYRFLILFRALTYCLIEVRLTVLLFICIKLR